MCSCHKTFFQPGSHHVHTASPCMCVSSWRVVKFSDYTPVYSV